MVLVYGSLHKVSLRYINKLIRTAFCYEGRFVQTIRIMESIGVKILKEKVSDRFVFDGKQREWHDHAWPFPVSPWYDKRSLESRFNPNYASRSKKNPPIVQEKQIEHTFDWAKHNQFLYPKNIFGHLKCYPREKKKRIWWVTWYMGIKKRKIKSNKN